METKTRISENEVEFIFTPDNRDLSVHARLVVRIEKKSSLNNDLNYTVWFDGKTVFAADWDNILNTTQIHTPQPAVDSEWTHYECFEGGDFYEIKLVLDHDDYLSVAQIDNISGCLAYALREVLAGEDLSEPTIVGKEIDWTSLVYSYDSTKSRRDDPDFTLAFRTAMEYITKGTPFRKTDRAGQGTKGTRLVNGTPAIETIDIYVR